MRYLLILIVTLTLTGEAMGNYNKNLSDRHPQVKVKTFSNNKKDVAKNFMEGWTSSGQNLKNYTQRQFKKSVYKKLK